MKTGILQSVFKVESLAAILLLATIIFAIAYQCFEREYSINAQSADWFSEVSDDRVTGGSSFTQNLSSGNELKYAYETMETEDNAYAIFILRPSIENQMRDLDWFKNIKITAHAIGSAPQRFHFMIRDHVDHISIDTDPVSSKYNEAYFELTNQPQTITIPRDSFQVPRWWVADKAVLPEDYTPSFSAFEAIELAAYYPNKPSSGTVVIEEITFSGPIMPAVDFYRGLFGIWFLLALPLCVGFYMNTRKARNIRRVRRNQIAQRDGKEETKSSGSVNKKSSIAAATAETTEIVQHDELTNLPNNFGIRDQIHEAIQSVRNGSEPANIILFDVDDFDLFNEAKGRANGDKVLQQIADLTQRTIPSSHHLARWRDDKFLIVCHDQSREDSKDLACELRRLIENETGTTCSFGVHQLNPINTIEEAIQRASKCVREAKFNGKNKVVLFNLRMPKISTVASTEVNPLFINNNIQPDSTSP